MNAIYKNRSSVRLAASQLVKELVWHICNVHRPGTNPDFAIFGSRRSGSTMLMQILGASPGVKYVDQPFSIFSASAYHKEYLSVFESGQYVQLDEDEWGKIVEFISGIKAGHLHINEPWRVWDTTFHFRSDRIVFKITDAHHLVDLLEREFGWETIFLTRHPIPQSLSVLNNGWGCRAKAFLSRESFVEKYLHGPLEGFAWDIYRSGSELEKHILGWCLENIKLIKSLQEYEDRSFVAYEHLLVDGGNAIQEISDAYGMGQRSMLSQFSKASFSTKKFSSDESKRDIKSGNYLGLLRGWRKRVDFDTEVACLNILERLGIDLYVPGKDMPVIPMKIYRKN